jgi:hypothetical protein
VLRCDTMRSSSEAIERSGDLRARRQWNQVGGRRQINMGIPPCCESLLSLTRSFHSPSL